ncbi:MAG: DUF1641 domain-containing protein [Gemmatimonadota bacterium]
MTGTETTTAAAPAAELELAEALRQANAKLDRLVEAMEGLHHRVESLEELREDLWPMIQGMSHQISRKLHEMEQSGTLAFFKETFLLTEVVAESFTPDDVQLLGANLVTILKTVRSMTQPEIMQIADRAASALKETEAEPPRKVSILKALRDPETRRGMTLLLSVLKEMGSDGNSEGKKAAAKAAITKA